MRHHSIWLVLLVAAGATRAEDIVTLPTRAGVTQSYLLSTPEKGNARAVAVLFAGGPGKVDLERETARTAFDHGNFLVRSRPLFTRNAVAVAVVDAPSDQPRGMDDAFRLGADHSEDIAKVVADLRTRFPGLPVYLVGTSRGTVSAAAVGRRSGKAVDGVVLTATLFLTSRKQPGLSGFDFSSIGSALLFVHHVDDGCAYTPHSSARGLSDRYPLISVAGGPPALSRPCEALSPHGFLGKEAETVGAIVKWMLKEPYPREIN
jgi:hypothetical protein